MTIPADQETSWIYKADRPALARLQNALEELWGTRPNRPATHGYAIRAGLVVGKLVEALEFYAAHAMTAGDHGDTALDALELARNALEGAQRGSAQRPRSDRFSPRDVAILGGDPSL